MNKKISLGVAVAIVIAFVTATFAITMSVSQRIYNKLISNLQQRIASYSLMDEADSFVAPILNWFSYTGYTPVLFAIIILPSYKSLPLRLPSQRFLRHPFQRQQVHLLAAVCI